MLIELLSLSNYVSYNIKVAQILGLEAAIYINEITNINEKALRKNKLDENFFTIDREYIFNRTTLTPEKQKEIEKNLLKIGILEKAENNPDTILLNITVLTSILMSPDETLIKNISKLAQAKPTKATKAQAIIENLKTNIITTNEELIEAYSEWIDSVYTKQGWMSKKAVICAQQVVDEFSNRNLDVALKVIEIATINGYRDMTWAVNSYKKDYNVSYRITSAPSTPTTFMIPQVSDEVF